MQVMQAGIDNLNDLVPLFDGYRQFYGKPSDLRMAEEFVQQRLELADTIFLYVMAQGRPAGFVHLFRSFSSVRCQPILLLNDLYVTPVCRRQGVARALMMASREYALQHGFRGIKLETQEHNKVGQSLYESLRYVKQFGFFTYFLPIKTKRRWFSKQK